MRLFLSSKHGKTATLQPIGDCIPPFVLQLHSHGTGATAGATTGAGASAGAGAGAGVGAIGSNRVGGVPRSSLGVVEGNGWDAALLWASLAHGFWPPAAPKQHTAAAALSSSVSDEELAWPELSEDLFEESLALGTWVRVAQAEAGAATTPNADASSGAQAFAWRQWAASHATPPGAQLVAVDDGLPGRCTGAGQGGRPSTRQRATAQPQASRQLLAGESDAWCSTAPNASTITIADCNQNYMLLCR